MRGPRRLGWALGAAALGALWGTVLLWPALWPLSFLYLIPAAWAAERWPRRHLAPGAFIAGFCQLLVSAAWVLPMGPIAWIGLGLITAVPMGVTGWLYATVRDRAPLGDWRRAMLFPAMLLLLELVRVWGPMGWTWHHFAHGLAGAPAPLLGLAAWIGLHGVGWALAVFAAAAMRWRATGSRRAALVLQAVTVLFLVGMAAPSDPTGRITVRAVASGLDTRNAWDLETFQEVGDFYSRESIAGAAEVVAWPESALVSSYPDPQAGQIAELAQRPVMYGAYQEQEGEYSNVYGVTYPDGTHGVPYRKRIIVPMGERVLWRGLVTRLLPGYPWPPQDVIAGPGDPPLALESSAVGPLICWEALFPRASRAHARAGATWLVVAANTSWFTPGSTQMTARFTRFRAVETGRGVLSVVTGGGSSLVDTRGRLVWQAPVEVDVAEDVVVETGTGITLYTRLGDWPLLLLSLATVASFWRRRVDNG